MTKEEKIKYLIEKLETSCGIYNCIIIQELYKLI